MAEDRKESIKRKLTENREEWLGVVDGFTTQQWEAPAYAEGSEWRVVDILRHVADSERGMTGLMMQIKAGGEGVSPDFDLARWNKRVVEKLSDKGPAELLEGMSQNRKELFAFIDTLDETDWDKKGRHASLRVMSIEEVCHLIADHEAQHLMVIKEALAL